MIGGGGSGIAVYRILQRLRIPFAAGVLPRNDVDFLVAQALAVEVVEVPAFCAVDDEAAGRARAIASKVDCVLMCVDERGPGNEANHRLFEELQAAGKRVIDCRGENGVAGLAKTLREVL